MLGLVYKPRPTPFVTRPGTNHSEASGASPTKWSHTEEALEKPLIGLTNRGCDDLIEMGHKDLFAEDHANPHRNGGKKRFVPTMTASTKAYIDFNSECG